MRGAISHFLRTRFDNFILALIYSYRTELLEFQNFILALGFGITNLLHNTHTGHFRHISPEMGALVGVIWIGLGIGGLLCLFFNGHTGRIRQLLNFGSSICWAWVSAVFWYHLPMFLVFSIPLSLITCLVFIRQSSIMREDW